MTTEPYPGTHYFCVDVETSALRIWEEGAHLFTIGVVVVDNKGNVVDDFYERIENVLHPSWHYEDMPAISDTQKWWREQSDMAKAEAYADPFRDRLPIANVARHFYDFCMQYGNDWTQRMFVASPDKFDWIWTDFLLSKAGLPDPFWYHGIDIWSINHGVTAQKRTGKAKGKLNLAKKHYTHDAKVPHHALSDAFALAQDLCDFLEKQPVELDAPHVADEVPYEAEDVVLPAGVPEEEGTVGESEDE